MLETPCVVIDNETVSRNISAMATSIAQRGVSLTPHIKTHKLPEMAQRQIEAGALKS